MPNDIKILVDGEVVSKLTSFDPSTREITEVYQLSGESEKELYFPGERTLIGSITPRSELTVIQSEDSPIALNWTCSEIIGMGVVNPKGFYKPSWQEIVRGIIDER